MFRSVLARSHSSAMQALLRRGSDAERKVAIFGAAGAIGQPLGLLTKLHRLVSNLSLYEVANCPGVAADGSHINTRSEAVVNMISKPVNSTVLIASEVLKKACTYDEKQSCGVATLDVVRAKTFYTGEAKVPHAGFGTGLCVARSVAASLACRRHFTTKSENPESAKATDAGYAVFENTVKLSNSEERKYVLKVRFPMTEQDQDRVKKFLAESREEIKAFVAKAEEEDKLVEDKK